MSSELQDPGASAESTVVELVVNARSYRIYVPNVATDYIQKKVATEKVPYESEMLEDIRERVSAGDLVLDVGANVGNHTLFLAAIAQCNVAAFEPNGDLCAALRESVRLNGFEQQITVHEVGLGRASSVARFGVDTPANLGGQHLDLGEGTISVVPLDTYRFDRDVKVIKIDVEGMEVDVLEGAQALIGRDRPLLYVECTAEKHYRAVSKWLERRNYVYWETFNATPTHLFMPLEQVTVEQRLQHMQIKTAQGDYRSNQLLREIRQRMNQALEREREARAALSKEQTKYATLASQKATLASEIGAYTSRLATYQAELAIAQTRHAAATADLTRQSESLTHALGELDATRLSLQKLSRTIEVRDIRLTAVERREAAYADRLERTKASATYRLGAALLAAGKSPKGFLRLPLQLVRMYRDVRARRAGATARNVSGEAPGAGSHRRPSVAQGAMARATPSADPSTVLAQRQHAAVLRAFDGELRKLRVAGIMDEFTFHSFQPECDLLPLRSGNWPAQVAEFKPQIVFIESAWKGVDDEWTLKVSNPSQALMDLIAWAREHDVPTVFWNKEDPVHFGGFQHVARAVDYVFTTDIDCIARYKRQLGHERVYLLPFAAQPAAHNPIERFPREDAFCFAGSYYLKYPERQRDFRSLLDVVKELKPVEIFDRNFGRAHAHYEFPPEYRPYIVGSLPFDQIDKAYKGYRYGINMNTIKQSQTMFARRVFELLASNTVVVSNFSRGLRLLFGDLVISSDSPVEIRRRLQPLSDDDEHLRKFRLAGLRKVMAEHTYRHRLAYIVGKLGGADVQLPSDRICAVAFPADQAQAHALVDAFNRQTFDAKHLCLVGPELPVELIGEAISHVASADRLAADPGYSSSAWVAPISAADYHGPNYLLDLHQATRYCEAVGIGKATRYVGTADDVQLIDDGNAYRAAEQLLARTSVLRRERFEALALQDAASLECTSVGGNGLVSIDEFNYAQGATSNANGAVRALVDDLPDLHTGVDIARDLLHHAERIRAAVHGDAAVGAETLPSLAAAELAELLPTKADAWVSDDCLHLSIAMPAGKHRYFYLERLFSRADLNLETNSRFQLLCEHDPSLDVRTVFEFLDENQQKISHAINKAGEAYSLPLPAICQSVRFGLRLQGRGELRIRSLLLADVGERPTVVVPTARLLVVLKQYPDYHDLYKYGFVHSRLRAYAERHVATDVFKLASDEPHSYREFENVDVTTGDRDLLDLALSSGAYRQVLIHLMDRAIWEVVRRHLDSMNVTVWVHGAEIQVWQRRQFEFERMDAAEVERQKRLSDQRRSFWREVLAAPHPNLRLVFVSQHFAQEVASDLGLNLANIPHEIIHNYIDPKLFPYVQKSPEDRLRVLSIRPFASRKYANDLTVAAIQSLSSKAWFGKMQFTIVGDGEMFDEITRPLARLPNVTLSKRFLTQLEIAKMHGSHGVFLCPTRMDAQGVSRDEAMSSGLVPITSAVAAIPEFVDERCGFLAPDEDYVQLAQAIEMLHHDPDRFVGLSRSASQRVLRQSGYAQTIQRELDLIMADHVVYAPKKMSAIGTMTAPHEECTDNACPSR
ncbi:FkbM family methyltransferase [Methylibium sp.]|uniref:FkbM family methyltransferase n=1 Tax=Methylibium sp. TaxID=2067992 RepID=UPI0017928061|nr:FkbM family methyltransferase [Methylibium sp.]MBA3588110.1 FkbM family methyltransferase [Methylibium sp.]